MEDRDRNRTALNQALRDILLEASEDELREALEGTGEDFHALANRGEAVVQRALSDVHNAVVVEELHRSLGVLLQMLRRRERVSLSDLARDAQVDVSELRRIENDPQFDPNPRTIFQIERYFNLPEKSLVVLSGAVHVDNDLRDEAVRFAASSEHVSELTKEERKLLNQFVKFLREHSDQ